MTPIGAFSSLAQAVANRTAEEALRFARQTVRNHANGILTWRERDGSEPIYRFSTPAEAEALTYPLSEADGAALSPVPPADREDVSLALYLLPYLTASDGDRIRRILAGRTETEVAAALLDFSSFLPPDRREACLAGRKALARDLTESGVSVILPPEQEEAS